MKTAVVMTCFNRCEKTINCIKKLHTGNDLNDYRFIVVDDNSKDGTCEKIEALGFSDVVILHGNGNLFWNGGMHMGIEYALNQYADFDFLLLVNDDVDFVPGILDKLISYSQKKHDGNAVIVGPTCNTEGEFSYGGILYTKSLNYEMLGPDRNAIDCTTFNANCTLIPMKIMKQVGNLDSYYKHSMGDFDLGFRVSRAGYKIHVFNEYVGVCNDNPKEGSWRDSSLGIIQRIKLKESFKGLPFKDWFHYLKNNFGIGTAIVRSFTPYIKILLKK